MKQTNNKRSRMILTLLLPMVFLSPQVHGSHFNHYLETPAQRDIESIISVKNSGQPKLMYLKSTESEEGHPIVQIGTMEDVWGSTWVNKPQYKFKPLDSIYSVNFECNLQENIPAEYFKFKFDLTNQNQILRDEGTFFKKQENSSPISLKRTYHAFLSAHFTSEKKECEVSAAMMHACQDWDAEQTPAHVKNTIAEYISEDSAADALEQCQQQFRVSDSNQKNIYEKLQEPQPILIKPVLMSHPLEIYEREKMTKLNVKPVNVHVREIHSNQDPQSKIHQKELQISCSLKSATDNNRGELGLVHFIFTAGKNNLKDGVLKSLGAIKKIDTKFGRGGAVPFLEYGLPDQDKNGEEVRVFQHYSKDHMLFALNKHVRNQKVEMPYAIDILNYNPHLGVLHRSIVDFQRNSIWKERFTNLKFSSLEELLNSYFWIEHFKDWRNLNNNPFILPTSVQINQCTN